MIVLLLILLVLLVAVGLGIILALLYFIPKGAPYVATDDDRLQTILHFAKIKKGTKVADFGAGDGRIVIACVKKGAIAHGYEIHPFLVYRDKRVIAREGLEGRAFMHWQNMWQVDFSRFDVVIVYGIPYIMRRLERKLQKELRPGARVVVNRFVFPSWIPDKQEGKVYLYTKI